MREKSKDILMNILIGVASLLILLIVSVFINELRPHAISYSVKNIGGYSFSLNDSLDWVEKENNDELITYEGLETKFGESCCVCSVTVHKDKRFENVDTLMDSAHEAYSNSEYVSGVSSIFECDSFKYFNFLYLDDEKATLRVLDTNGYIVIRCLQDKEIDLYVKEVV